MVNDDIREIKSKIDIVEVVGDYVTLRKKGQSFWGCCPFHGEKTPSFSVSPERQTYHCFGCNRGGDIFTFIMEMEHLEFKEALERLAERAGVTLQVFKSGNRSKSNTIKDANLFALDFFASSLESSSGKVARAYLERRFISLDIAKRFGIGWAPASWNALEAKLESLGFSNEDMVESGLVSQGNKGLYDRFRGRVMFPIYSVTDRLIGFGGRILEGDEAKYLNSPESQLFNKRNNLYLLNKAKSEIRNKGYLILVEGYMDAIRAHLNGYANTVASLGTALTESQASLIKRMSSICYICYDSDAAGTEATLRGMYILQREGITVKVVRLTTGKDPDEVLLREHGLEEFQSAIDNALPLPIYHAMLKSKDLAIPEKANSAKKDLLDGLATLSTFDVAPYLDEVARILGIFSHELKKELDSRHEIVRGVSHKKPIPEDDTSSLFDDDVLELNDSFDDLECLFCSLIWNDEKVRANFEPSTTLPFIRNDVIKTIVFGLLSGESTEALESRWRQMNDSTSLRALAKGNSLVEKGQFLPDFAHSLLKTLRKKCIENRAVFLQDKLKKGTATNQEIEEHLNLTRILKGGAF
ncbi:MAG: DNA primase [Synergistaceae bacterium]